LLIFLREREREKERGRERRELVDCFFEIEEKCDKKKENSPPPFITFRKICFFVVRAGRHHGAVKQGAQTTAARIHIEELKAARERMEIFLPTSIILTLASREGGEG
jgi:hypothetical protein